MSKRALRRRLERDYGRVPDTHYFPEDMGNIRAYFDYRRSQGRDAFLLDETTWNDLDLDRLFQRINPRLSTSGEQYLYYLLRSPALDAETWRERQALAALMAGDPKRRLALQMILGRLGCTRRADLALSFAPEEHGWGMLVLYAAMGALPLILALLGLLLRPALYGIAAAALLFNLTFHEFRKRRVQRQFDTVNYAAAMILALHRVRKLRDEALNRELAEAYPALDQLRSVLRVGSVSGARDGGIAEFLAGAFLLDLIAFEYLRAKLSRCREALFTVHESLGRLDAAIAVASYRESLGEDCRDPELDFKAETPYLSIRGLRHPLLPDPVPNDLDTRRSVLLTGSNASGKSTFLRSVLLCAVMAQSLGICPAESYRAPAFRILSSMALRDDLLAGESYYIVETRSLKRILDAAQGSPPLLCVVDEVLRGTNTVERVAASCEVLRAIPQGNALCLAATHDGELCSLLADCYDLYHFTETVGETEMTFDYRLRPGPATSRNAIRLLGLLGFPETVVEGAQRRAEDFLREGRWRREK